MIGDKGDMPGSFAQPKSVDVDSDDHVYVVDNRFEAVQIFDANGQLLLNFGQEGRGPGQFWLPTGIFIDPTDRIWIADSYNRRVQVFDYLGDESVTPVQESKQ
jgi:streptogramin lyase